MSVGTEARTPEMYGQDAGSILDRLRGWLVGSSIRQAAPRRPGLRALDLGCGYGAHYLRMLRPLIATGVGVDFEVSEEAKQIPGFSFVHQPIETAVTGLETSSFDLILFISALEHVADPEGTLRHCYRIMAPGARLLINVPTWWAKPVLEYSAFRLGTSPAAGIEDHKLYYDKRTLWPMLVKAGFRPSRICLRYRWLGMTLFASIEK